MSYTDEGAILRIIIACLVIQELIACFNAEDVTLLSRFYIGVGSLTMIITLKCITFMCIALWVFGENRLENEGEPEFLSYRYQ